MKKRILAALLCLGCANFAAFTAASDPTPAPLEPIRSLDVLRYMGRWYDVAHYPNRFQARCVADSRAEYRLLPGGDVQVTNRCRLADGRTDAAEGLARQLGAADSARLQVRFAPAWLSFLSAVWGDYWVVDIADDYRWAVVSEPRREYLWVLSRTPQLDAADTTRVHARLVELGFDPARLVTLPTGE